jgi:hypothetical protein
VSWPDLIRPSRFTLAKPCHGYRDCRDKPGDDAATSFTVLAMHVHPSCCSRRQSFTARTKKIREAKRRKARTTCRTIGCGASSSGGRSPSGASPRRLSRRSTARNSVQAALHAMKCEGVTFAWVTALKRSTSRLGRSTERVDARTARGRK